MTDGRRSSPSAAPAAPGRAVEREVVIDMIRRSAPVLPALVLVAGLIWGVNGALSAAFAIGLVLLNFLVSASLLAWSARIAVMMMMVAALGGFVVRLALISVAVLAVKDHAWVEMMPLGLTLVVTHLGLLIWEARHVSMSLAFPAVKPALPERR
jgi:hypothetical protein